MHYYLPNRLERIDVIGKILTIMITSAEKRKDEKMVNLLLARKNKINRLKSKAMHYDNFRQDTTA